MADFADKLCGVERDRMTAAEICIDECLTIMDRHGSCGSLYSSLRNMSQSLNTILRDADGMAARYERLIRVRSALTAAFPMTDEDLEGSLPPQAKVPTVLQMVEAMAPEELANWEDDSNCNAGKCSPQEGAVPHD